MPVWAGCKCVTICAEAHQDVVLKRIEENKISIEIGRDKSVDGWVGVENKGGDQMCTRFTTRKFLPTTPVIGIFLEIPERYWSSAVGDCQHLVAHRNRYGTWCTLCLYVHFARIF